MFELHKQIVKLKEAGPRIAKRGKDKEPMPEITLKLTMSETNDYLSLIDPTLKSSYFKKDEGPDANDVFVGSENELRKVKHPKVKGPYKVDDEIIGAEVTLSYGVDSEIVLENATAYGLRFNPQEGGTCIYSFNVKADAVGRDVGRIVDSLLGNEVTITIKKPTSPQTTLID